MAATGSWANVGRDMLASIAAGNISLGDYVRLRGVCTAWRSTLEPPFPCILRLANDGHSGPVRASVFSLPGRHFFRRLYLGSSVNSPLHNGLYDNLINRAYGSGSHAISHASIVGSYGSGSHAISHASIVGSSGGRLAVAIHTQQRDGSSQLTATIFLLHPRSGEEVQIRSPTTAAHDERVRKVAFAPNTPHAGPKEWPTVVALYGRDKVAYIDAARSKVWTTVDMPYKMVPVEHIVDLAFDAAGGDKVYCLDIRGGVRALKIPSRGQNQNTQLDPVIPAGPILVSDDVAPPYHVAIQQNPSSKHLFFLDGNMYQVWQTKRMSQDEILVLRFYPERRPCWDAVKDLGGCSVFVGDNSDPTVVRGVRGVRPDCVYWISKVAAIPNRVMVYDVAVGTSDLIPCGKNRFNCWFFDDANVMLSLIDDKKQKRKRCSE